MAPPIAFDLTRLFLGPVIPTPRGIDRVDLGYAAHFLERWPGDCVATLPMPWGVRAIERSAALRVVRTVASIWGEMASPDDDPAYKFVKSRLAGVREPPVWLRGKAAAARRAACGMLRSIAHSGGMFGVRAAGEIPEDAVYLNTGQLGLACDWMMAWLRRRPDVKPVFMLHDTIPIDYPEYVAPIARRLHANMISNSARYARGIIVTTETVRHSVTREIERRGRRDLSIFAARLPVAPAFLKKETPDPDLAGRRYFVVCGTIEPRKNHRLLLEIWRQLVREEGASAPKLVVVGTPWRRSASVIEAVRRSQELRDSVILVSGLTTPALRRLLSGATALLMPSLVEGFGLPIIEALARGTPVIASDLPAHREAGGSDVTYVDAGDRPAWLAAIRAHLDGRRALREKLANHRAWTWADYAGHIEPFVEAVWREPRRGEGLAASLRAVPAPVR